MYIVQYVTYIDESMMSALMSGSDTDLSDNFWKSRLGFMHRQIWTQIEPNLQAVPQSFPYVPIME